MITLAGRQTEHPGALLIFWGVLVILFGAFHVSKWFGRLQKFLMQSIPDPKPRRPGDRPLLTPTSARILGTIAITIGLTATTIGTITALRQ
ncbi:hypothetical protein [Kitasatospora sp. CB02891]|uniref:hypothetical protein n=1 Tax=Kitasatospora sp. CB02891 TaxID=2020329 RepID=UPI000C27B669|nr:hypothetical protein [Kitasatospora sp. CB02891]PJN22852.1 hypothetical protein CG736_26345 [Kitasatospora sp. CB02891]